jgi:hypothetical protein
MAAWDNYKVKRQLEHTDFHDDAPASKRARESMESEMLQGKKDEPEPSTQAKRGRESEGLQSERTMRPSENLQLERDRVPADDSPSQQQHLFDLDNLKSLQRLNAKYNASLKYVPLRNMLVSFVSDVCDDHSLMNITIHRAMNYLDRLLSR